MRKLCCIYCIANQVSGKRYIGQTEDFSYRKRKHLERLRRGNHYNLHLQNAWNMYGESSFVFEIIQECENTKLDELEIYYIDRYDCTNESFGYNIMEGGSANPSKNLLVREKISNTLKRKYKSGEIINPMNNPEHRKKLQGENNPMFGVHRFGKDAPNFGKLCSEETKNKIGKSNKGKGWFGKKNPEHAKKMSGRGNPMFGIRMGTIVVTNPLTKIIKFIKKEELAYYVQNGFIKGRPSLK